VDTFWVERAHVPGFVRVEGPHLDEVLEDRSGEALEVELVDRHVERGDHFLGVANQLAAQLAVERLQVSAVHVQKHIFHRVNLHNTNCSV